MKTFFIGENDFPQLQAADHRDMCFDIVERKYDYNHSQYVSF